MPHDLDDRSNRTYPHLQVSREDFAPERRHRAGFPGGRPDRGGRRQFAPRLSAAVDRLLEEQATETRPTAGIQPHLVFRVPLASGTNPDAIEPLLRRAGLQVVSIGPDRVVVVFKADADVAAFRDEIRRYERGPRTDPRTGERRASTVYDVLEWIEPESMHVWSRIDRIGRRIGEIIGLSGEQIDMTRSYILNVDLWHPGTRLEAERALGEVRQLVRSDPDAKSSLPDYYIGDSLLLGRVRMPGAMLDQLLSLTVVAQVELPPVADFDTARAAQATRRDFPTPPMPPEDGPRVCIIDSGIIANHPLLRANVGHEEAVFTATASPADAHGHGTMVAGLAVFGDVRACYEAGQFSSPITMFSARVLNEHNAFDDDELAINQIGEAIRIFKAPPYDCRVFNLSVGSREPAFIGEQRHQTAWAESLDILARELQVLIVVSAGNHREAYASNASDAERSMQSYPDLLFRPDAQLCDPATAALVLTVGGLVQHDTVGMSARPDTLGADDIIKPLASVDQPAPMTRTGPGVLKAIKPELAHYAGNLVFRGTGNSRNIGTNPGTSVMSLSNDPTQSLFAYDVGTSFAAPRVARLAALLYHELRQQLGEEPHQNLVRAILASSAAIPGPVLTALASVGGGHAATKACGYGLPDDEFALNSTDRRVTLIYQGRMALGKYGHVHFIGVPIPEAFQIARGVRTISVSLAHDPPVRRRRYDYLGVEMDMVLIRGKTLDEVRQALGQGLVEDAESVPIPSPYRIALEPPATSRTGDYCRGKSTLQHAVFTRTHRDSRDYGSEYWLVVQARRKWAPLQIEFQDYAVAITLEADSAELYAQLRARLQQRARIRHRG